MRTIYNSMYIAQVQDLIDGVWVSVAYFRTIQEGREFAKGLFFGRCSVFSSGN